MCLLNRDDNVYILLTRRCFKQQQHGFGVNIIIFTYSTSYVLYLILFVHDHVQIQIQIYRFTVQFNYTNDRTHHNQTLLE